MSCEQTLNSTKANTDEIKNIVSNLQNSDLSSVEADLTHLIKQNNDIFKFLKGLYDVIGIDYPTGLQTL